MKIWVIAVGQKIPSWVQEVCADYLKRFPSDWRVEVKTVKVEPRTAAKTAEVLMATEAQRIEQIIATCTQYPYIIALDERGVSHSSIKMASALQNIELQGQEVVLVIGGPDGLSAAFKQKSHALWRLSDLTLPHAMVRALLVEQLYRCWSILANHPYHRE